MRLIRNRKGYTMLEAVTALSIMGLVTACTFSMLFGAMRTCDNAASKAYTDADAVLAMQRIVADVREAKSVQVLSSGRRLRITFPVRTAGGYYDRHTPDTGNQIDYYLSDSSGEPNNSGTWLWRGKNSNDRMPIKRNVESLLFEMDPNITRQVTITVVANEPYSDGTTVKTQETKLTQRVVYLRNY